MASHLDHLVIVSHAIHYEQEGVLFAYGPYAREIDIWASLFPRVTIAAPLRHEPPPGDCIPLRAGNLAIAPQLETGGDTVLRKLHQALFAPAHLWRLHRVLRRADAIHVRCPGNLGLPAAIMAPFYSRRIVAKYAGQWSERRGEPVSYRVQRAILKSALWRHGVVTVYGDWPGQPSQVVPFFTSMMTREQVECATAAAARKRLTMPLRLLYAGRLAAGKGVDALLLAAARLRDAGVPVETTILGDGPERLVLERLADVLGLRAVFAGAVGYEKVMQWYQQAHVLVLASATEGWPKVLPEAMCHGVVCAGTARGIIPWMLDGRGLTLARGDAEEIRQQRQAHRVRRFAPHRHAQGDGNDVQASRARRR